MTAAAVPGASGSLLAARTLHNEAAKGLLLLWRRRGVLIASIAESAFAYLLIRFLIGGGHIGHPLVAATLPALLAQFVASTAALQGSGGIAEEVNSGTLEQAQLGPAAPTLPVFGRLGALAVEGFIGALALGLGFGLGFAVHYSASPDVLVPILLTILDALGYAFLIIALTLAVASIGAVTHVFNMAIMFLNGMLVPIGVFPSWIQVTAEFFPTTLGVRVLNSTLAGRPLSAAWGDGTLPWLLVHVFALFSLGWCTYVYTIRRARREGGLVSRR
jgi:ABC-2 type transport system permease protein